MTETHDPAQPPCPLPEEQAEACQFCSRSGVSAHSCAHFYGESVTPSRNKTPAQLLDALGDLSEVDEEKRCVLRSHIQAQAARIAELERERDAARLAALEAAVGVQ